MTLAVPIEGQDLRMGQEARRGRGLRADRKTASRRVRSGERQAFGRAQTAENLTFWAYRYPGLPETKLPPKPSSQDIKKRVEQIQQLAKRYERWLAQREAAR
jgi:hypothetical protein